MVRLSNNYKIVQNLRIFDIPSNFSLRATGEFKPIELNVCFLCVGRKIQGKREISKPLILNKMLKESIRILRRGSLLKGRMKIMGFIIKI
jgi:hypothetical protein